MEEKGIEQNIITFIDSLIMKFEQEKGLSILYSLSFLGLFFYQAGLILLFLTALIFKDEFSKAEDEPNKILNFWILVSILNISSTLLSNSSFLTQSFLVYDLLIFIGLIYLAVITLTFWNCIQYFKDKKTFYPIKFLKINFIKIINNYSKEKKND